MGDTVLQGGVSMSQDISNNFSDAPPDQVCLPCVIGNFLKGFSQTFGPAFLMGLGIGLLAGLAIATFGAPALVFLAIAGVIGLGLLGKQVLDLAKQWPRLSPDQRALQLGRMTGSVTGGLAGGAIGGPAGLAAGRAAAGPASLAGAADETVTVYRVEGEGNQRVLIDSNGNVEIPEVFTRAGSERNLYLNFGDEARAQQFLQQRLEQFPDNSIKSFEVQKSFLDELRGTAVDEQSRSLYPDRPVIADPTKASDQFGLSAQQIGQLRNNIVPGSGKQLK